METVVLTKERILNKTKVHSLEEVKTYSDYAYGFTDVSIISELPNVKNITLSANKISSLEPFSKCTNLTELYLRRNNISSLNELYYLQNLSNLKVLWLSDNPIAEIEGYRDFAIAILPQITKLDEQDISPAERTKANQKYPNPEISVPSSLASVPRSNTPSHNIQDIQTISNSTQRHLLAAINNLLLELDKDSLEVLLDQINQMKTK